jgi:hypothetical protein
MSVGLIIFGGFCILAGIAVLEHAVRCFSPRLRGPHYLLAATCCVVGVASFVGGGWAA